MLVQAIQASLGAEAEKSAGQLANGSDKQVTCLLLWRTFKPSAPFRQVA